MKVKVFTCRNCDNETPCILPKSPYKVNIWSGCEWDSCPYIEGTGADFQLEELELCELINYFIKCGKYLDYTQICRIPGRMACTSGHEGKCSECEIAFRYENPE